MTVKVREGVMVRAGLCDGVTVRVREGEGGCQKGGEW